MKLLVVQSWSQGQIETAQRIFPQVQFVSATEHHDILREIVDAEVVFGGISRDLFLTAERLK